jgi:hypothetical protein
MLISCVAAVSLLLLLYGVNRKEAAVLVLRFNQHAIKFYTFSFRAASDFEASSHGGS